MDLEQETHVEQVAHHEEHEAHCEREVQSHESSVPPMPARDRADHDFPITTSITWTRTIFMMVAAGNVVA